MDSLHQAAGMEGVDEPLAAAAVAMDYGDPVSEYHAVRDAAGVADRDDLAFVVLSGRDPVRMVQGLITNDLSAAGEDRAVYGAMLTPKGRTIAELQALTVTSEPGTEVWLLIPREVLEGAAAHLRRSVPPLYARWRDASEDLAILGVYGPRSRELLSSTLGADIEPLAEDALASVHFEGAVLRLIGSRSAGGEVGYDLLIERRLLAALREKLLTSGEGWARRVGFSALEMLRIEAGRPRGGRELTEETIPTESFESTGLMERAISFGKGCYTGQEVIVRIAHRGHVNRHLRGLVLPASDDGVSTGTRLHHPETGKDVGWVTSVAPSPLLDGPVALAFVRREVEPGQHVLLGHPGGEAAEVRALPFHTPPVE